MILEHQISSEECVSEAWSNAAEKSTLHHNNKLYFKIY